MLNSKEFLEKFKKVQNITVRATNQTISDIHPGMSEHDIAVKYEKLLKAQGLTDHWYPILIYSGEWTGKPIARRIHLPSEDVFIQKSDIICLDSTPIDKNVWGNWCRTISIGDNKFFQELCIRCDEIVDQAYKYSKKNAKHVGDIYEFCMSLIHEAGLSLLDSRGNVGHSIFQVPVGQTVEKIPESERLFLDKASKDIKLQGIISIEPQVGRISPDNGKMYGAKQQRIIIFD